MEKIVLTVPKEISKASRDVIRIDEEASKILRRYYNMTSIPISKIASKMIKFANEYVEIEEV